MGCSLTRRHRRSNSFSYPCTLNQRQSALYYQVTHWTKQQCLVTGISLTLGRLTNCEDGFALLVWSSRGWFSYKKAQFSVALLLKALMKPVSWFKICSHLARQDTFSEVSYREQVLPKTNSSNLCILWKVTSWRVICRCRIEKESSHSHLQTVFEDNISSYLSFCQR